LASDYSINDPSPNRSRPNFSRSNSSFDNAGAQPYHDFSEFSSSSVNLVNPGRLGRATASRDSQYSLVDQLSPRQNQTGFAS